MRSTAMKARNSARLHSKRDIHLVGVKLTGQLDLGERVAVILQPGPGQDLKHRSLGIAEAVSPCPAELGL